MLFQTRQFGVYISHHNQMLCLVSLILVAVGSIRADDAAAMSEIIPRKIMFTPERFWSVQLSPHGVWMSWMSYDNGTPNIWVRNLTSDDSFMLTNETGRGIDSYTWAFDNRTMVYSQDKDGDENWRLYAVDVFTKNVRLLTDTEGVSAGIFAKSVKYPTKFIIGLNNRDPAYHDVYTLDILTGEKELIFKNDRYSAFIFDNDMKIRILLEILDNCSNVYYLFDPQLPQAKNTEFPVFKTVDFKDTTVSHPTSFDKTNKMVYWMDNNDGKDDLASFYLIDVATKNKTLIYRATKEPIDDVFFHPTEKKPLTLALNYDKYKRVILDKEFGEPFQIVIEKLSKIDLHRYKKWEDISIVTTSLDLHFWIVMPRSDQGPGHYYFFNKTDQSVKFLFSMNPVLDPYKFSPMHPVEILVSDNLTELCYLTLPVKSDPNATGRPYHPVPMIMIVHGGPWSRDEWGFSVETQYFANRGYAIMQCNFRSSKGLGKKLWIAGIGEWAGKMRTDLIEAAEWAIRNKITKRDKVAIYGYSYGGYAVLAGLTFSPEFYACGVDIVGVSHLMSFLKSIPAYWKPAINDAIRKIGGDPNTTEGRVFLESISPLNFAHQIKKPLLIGQGLNDPRVKVSESLQIVDALKKAKLPFTYMMFPNEGHGFARPENKLAFFAEVEQFFANCLGGRAETVQNEFNESLVEIERYYPK